MASTDTQQPECVQDPVKDIALHVSLEQCTVNIPGRQKFQRIWVRHGLKKHRLTTWQYDPKADAPKGWYPNMMPTPRETTPSDGEVEMMVVGLFLLDEPSKYSAAGNGGLKEDATAKEDRLERGSWLRLKRMGRVVTRVTPFFDADSKLNYYAVLQPVNGISPVRLLKQDAVFFFEEFWPNNVKDNPAKSRPSAFGLEVRRAVADKKYKDPSSEDLVRVEEKGVQAFFDEGDEFPEATCDLMIGELNSAHKDLVTLKPDIVQTVRKVFFNLKLHESIPTTCLATFLSSVHKIIALKEKQAESSGVQSLNMENIVQIAALCIDGIEVSSVETTSTTVPAATTPDLFEGTRREFDEAIDASFG